MDVNHKHMYICTYMGTYERESKHFFETFNNAHWNLSSYNFF
jgi:hypothetical protein